MADTIQTTFADSSKNGRITLYVNPFNNGSEYYGRFERNTVNTANLIARIQKKQVGTNELAVNQITGLLKEEILEAIRSGESVNVMDLGTFYISTNAKFNGTSIEQSDKPLCVKFTPSQLVQNAVEDIQIKNVTIATTEPQITSITDQLTGNTDKTLTAKMNVLIEGNRIKIGGDKSGVFLCPLDENQDIVKDESLWISCPRLIKNTNSKVEFYLGASALPDTSYKILLRTYYLNGSTQLKTSREVTSDVVTILAASE